MRTWLLMLPLAACGGPVVDSGAPELAFDIDPGVAAPGDLFIGVLSASRGVDFSRVAEVYFLDGARVCASKVRADEMLLTVGVGREAEGVLDLLILFEGGDSVLVDDALTVTSGGGGEGYPCE